MDADPTPFFRDFYGEIFFHRLFSYNLTAGTLSSVVIKFFAKFGVKMLFCKQYFSPLNTFMRKGKDPDPDQYL
jgi:hypothetical protein